MTAVAFNNQPTLYVVAEGLPGGTLKPNEKA